MNILVTGANGQLGRELRLLAQGSSHRFVFTDIAEIPGLPVERLDILDAGAVDRLSDRESIDLIINCAAYTDVERAEDEPEMAMRLNAEAPANLARTALRRNAFLVHISTDYVFPGDACTPIPEDAPTQPLSVYGKTKLAGEEAVLDTRCKAIILRTAWLYSPFGKNFVKSMLRLTEERDSLNVVFDQTGSPTAAADLAAAILYIVDSAQLQKCGVYHYTDEGVTSWYDFARAIAALGGNACEIRPCRSSQFPTKARRPQYSVLDKTLFRETFGIRIPWWMDSLKQCIDRL